MVVAPCVRLCFTRGQETAQHDKADNVHFDEKSSNAIVDQEQPSEMNQSVLLQATYQECGLMYTSLGIPQHRVQTPTGDFITARTARIHNLMSGARRELD